MMQNQEKIELLKKAKGSIDNEFTQLEEIYVILYAISKIVMDETRSKTMVPIKSLIMSEKIEIYERNLSTVDDNFVNELLGTLEKIQGEWRIYINQEIGSLTKRYVMAHEFSHYIVNSIETIDESENCTNVLFPLNTGEQICDIISSFLLLPFGTVVKLLNTYIDNRRKEYGSPVNLDEWIQYLGNEMGLTEYHTILSYQNIRYLAGALYQYSKVKSKRGRVSKLLKDLNVTLEDEIQMIEKNMEFFQRH